MKITLEAITDAKNILEVNSVSFVFHYLNEAKGIYVFD